MASVTLYPATVDKDYSAYSIPASYPVTKPIGKNSTNTTYAQFYLTRGSSAETYFKYYFDLSSIPNGVTITNASVKVKSYISTTSSSYVTSRTMGLNIGSYKGLTTFSNSTTAYTITPSLSEFIKTDSTAAYIRCSVTRGTTNTSSNYYVRFYGAELTITYEDNRPDYNITIQKSSDTVTDPAASTTVKEGESFTLKITSGMPASMTDNGTNVLSQLIEKQTPNGETTSFHAAAYTTSGSISGTRYKSAIGQNSSTTVSGNDYASSSGNTATITYSFDFSDIPSNATITSVSVKVGGHAESTSNSSRKSALQLYKGSATVGSVVSFTSTSHQVVTLSAGTWTRAELDTAKITFTIGYYGGAVGGIDFDVTYTIPDGGQTYYEYVISSVTSAHTIAINIASDTLYVKLNGEWVQVKEVYKKISGVWVLQSDKKAPFTGLSDGDKTILINGGTL